MRGEIEHFKEPLFTTFLSKFCLVQSKFTPSLISQLTKVTVDLVTNYSVTISLVIGAKQI